MQPNRMFAVAILLVAGALLLSGYLVPALLAAVFGVLAFAARNTGSGSTIRDEAFIADGSSSSWSSSNGGGNDNACDAGDSGSDGGGDCGGDGGSGGD
jgi:hypothetical protein